MSTPNGKIVSRDTLKILDLPLGKYISVLFDLWQILPRLFITHYLQKTQEDMIIKIQMRALKIIFWHDNSISYK